MFFARPVVALGLMAVLAALFSVGGDARAQQIYRIVGPDGRVTFSDKPPIEPTAKASAAPVVRLPQGSTSALPFELRQVASRYPVTLYTTANCAPCARGRSLLSGRGVPFVEKTVISSDDVEALRRIGGATSLPFLTIGGQQIKGFSEIEWVQFLDAAGYPRTSQLPAGYPQAPATPLVAVTAPPPAPESEPERAPAPEPEPAAPTALPESPSGIRF